MLTQTVILLLCSLVITAASLVYCVKIARLTGTRARLWMSFSAAICLVVVRRVLSIWLESNQSEQIKFIADITIPVTVSILLFIFVYCLHKTLEKALKT